jgi:hypothetical protein
MEALMGALIKPTVMPDFVLDLASAFTEENN